MSNLKTDRRIKYTKMVLKNSLIELLKTKSIDKITIKAICELADINRSTFYAHYHDQYDLLKQIEQEVLEEINIYLNNHSFIDNEAESSQIITRIFEYIVANAELCKVLLSDKGGIALQKELMMIVQRQSMTGWHGVNQIDSELIEYFLLYGVNGSIGIVQKWLQTGMKKTAREMAEIIVKLTYQGISAYL